VKTEQPPKAEKDELDRKEWCFNLDSVPKPEIEACFIYEYARELVKRSPRIFDLLAKYRAGWNGKKRTPQFLEGWKAYIKFRKIMEACFPGYLILYKGLYEDWFPDTPWQELDQKVQRELVKDANSAHADQSNWPFDKLMMQTKDGNVSLEPFRKAHRWLCREDDLSQTEYGFFAVNWNYPETMIREAFDKWTSLQLLGRKARGLKETKYNRKGRRVGPRDRLNWLGALRLFDHYGRKGLVDDSASNISPSKRVKIKNPPYFHLSDLYEAAEKARDLLKAMSKLAGRN
jgi:hypothetical protein